MMYDFPIWPVYTSRENIDDVVTFFTGKTVGVIYKHIIYISYFLSLIQIFPKTCQTKCLKRPAPEAILLIE